MSYDIFTAAETNNHKRIKELLDSGQDVNEQDWDRGATPLHLACAKGNLETIELLIDYGANVNSQNKYGRTCLHHLILNRYDNIAIWLIKHCNADPHLPDKKGVSAYDLAIKWLQEQLDEAIKTRGQTEDDSDSSEEDGSTPQPQQPQQTQSKGPVDETLKVFLRNGSYKNIPILANSTAEDLANSMAEKLGMPIDHGKFLEVYEVIKKRETKVERGESVAARKSKWPLIFGKTGNETTLHCYFTVLTKPGCPPKVTEMYQKG